MLSAPQPHAKQPVSAALAGPYGHPFHPILVTLPIGAWVASLVFEHRLPRPMARVSRIWCRPPQPRGLQFAGCTP
ncbi:MAG: hypothetical protein ACJ72W_21365 [Actinoallomurus sp.]